MPMTKLPWGIAKCLALAASAGHSVTEYKPKDERAITEINNLYNYIFHE